MASGILAAQRGTIPQGSSTVIYTVPAGISYQSVHITLPLTRLTTGAGISVAELQINNKPYLRRTAGTTTSTPQTSVSLILSPGDVIKLACYGAAGIQWEYSIIVSGYSVP